MGNDDGYVYTITFVLSYQKLEKIFLKWGDLVHHSPVMLAWAAVRFTVMDDDVDTPNVHR